MNLEKAKEIINLNIKDRSPRMPPDVLDALKLGSEAITRVQDIRTGKITMISIPLSGETEE